MKIKLLTIILFLSILLLPAPLKAEEIPIVTIQISSDTAKDCRAEIYLWGCYDGAESIKKIYISDQLNVEEFEYVFWHEAGHFYLDGENLTLFNNDPEIGANMFYEFTAPDPICYNTYVDWCGQLNQPMKDLFRKLMIEKEVKMELLEPKVAN